MAIKFDDGKYQVTHEHNNLTRLHQAGCIGIVDVLAYITEVRWKGRHRDVLVTPLLGQDLHSLVEQAPQGKLPPRAVCWVALQLLVTLRNVHERNHVHRDIKPANIVVRHFSFAAASGGFIRHTSCRYCFALHLWYSMQPNGMRCLSAPCQRAVENTDAH